MTQIICAVRSQDAIILSCAVLVFYALILCDPFTTPLASQIVCDTDLLITTGVYGWPGKVNDARVWRNSSIGQMLEAGTFITPGAYTLWAGTVRLPPAN